MTLNPGNNPFAPFTGLDGRPLNNGRVYIGVAGQDPETNPQDIFWDADGNVSANNPMQTQAGYIWNAGGPARFWTQDNAYSIRVRDRLGQQVFYAANVAFEMPAGVITADAISDDRDGQAAILRKLGGVQRVGTQADLVALPKPSGPTVVTVEGYDDPDQDFGFQYRWEPGSTAADNGGTVISSSAGGTGRWILMSFDGTVPATAFGAIPDRLDIDTTARVQAALDAAAGSTVNAAIVVVARGQYRWDGTVVVPSYTRLEFAGPSRVQRLSANSSSEAPVLFGRGVYWSIEGRGTWITTENRSPRGILCCGHETTTNSNYGAGFYFVRGLHLMGKDWKAAGVTPAQGESIGLFIPSSQPTFGSNAYNYFGHFSEITVHACTDSYWLTDTVNSMFFVGCRIEFFWYNGWVLRGAYGNTINAAFINGCYRDGGRVIWFGPKMLPSAPHAAGHESTDNRFVGPTIELYSDNNIGVQVDADCVRNHVAFGWNSHGTSIVDNSNGNNYIDDRQSTIALGQNLLLKEIQIDDTASSGRSLCRVGPASYPNSHSISRTGNSPALIVENKVNTSASTLSLYYNRGATADVVLQSYDVSNAVTRFQVLANGTAQNATGSYTTISDGTLKENVEPATSQWDDVKFLAESLVHYTLKSDPDQRKLLGWIAQTLQPTCPGLVNAVDEQKLLPVLDEDGQPVLRDDGQPVLEMQTTGRQLLTVNQSITAVKAIGALGEAMTRIEALEKEIEAIKSST